MIYFKSYTVNDDCSHLNLSHAKITLPFKDNFFSKRRREINPNGNAGNINVMWLKQIYGSGMI